MSTGSAVPAVIDTLIASLSTALPAAAVFDGAGATDLNPPLAVHVGLSDVDDDGWSEAAASSQGWAWLGHSQRDEQFSVHCDVIAWNGTGDAKAARDAAYTALTAVASAITGDPALGGSALYTVGLTTSALFQIQSATGAAARLPFDVTCRARLS